MRIVVVQVRQVPRQEHHPEDHEALLWRSEYWLSLTAAPLPALAALLLRAGVGLSLSRFSWALL